MAHSAFSLNSFSLTGKKALITGGNTGLGHSFSAALAIAGADIFVASTVDDSRETKTAVNNAGRIFHAITTDLTEEGNAEYAIDSCLSTLGGLDILVNCAGISILADVRDFGRKEWDKMVSVNLTAAFEMSHYASKHMIEQASGKIINICSLFSFLGGQLSPAYAATKHGIAGLTKAYCDELAQYNIQVNGIAPGYFKTELTKNTRQTPSLNQAVIDHTPSGDWGDLEDLMGPVVFLASSASNYVNGHVLVVDGGYLVR